MNERDAQRRKRILCLGDSNTYGYDPRSSFGGRYPPEERWTARLQASGLLVFNRGMNGACVPIGGEISAFANLIGSLLPLDAVTVMFGTNDLLRGADAAHAAAAMGRFLPSVRAAAPGAAVILLAPPPMTYGDWVREAAVIRESEHLAASYRRLAAEEGVTFADAGEWGVPLSFDGVHFTPEGHAAFFRGLAGVLDAAFQRAETGDAEWN